MAYLNDAVKQQLKTTLFSVKFNSDSILAHIIGVFVGSRISLLGCTNVETSFNAVKVEMSKLISEINELRTFNVDNAVNIAREIAKDRYEIFFTGFNPLNVGQYPGNTVSESLLSDQNTGEQVQAFFTNLAKCLEGTGMSLVIHNQTQEASQPEQPAEAPAEQPQA